QGGVEGLPGRLAPTTTHIPMNETQPQDRPTTADPETEEYADVTVRAEEGDEAATVALEEAGDGGTAPDEPSEETVVELGGEAEPAPEDDVTDVPTEEATALEAEAEQALPADIAEGEDEGPLVAAGPERYVAEESPAEEALRAPPPPEAEAVAAPEP